jgi:hypothetical protein
MPEQDRADKTEHETEHSHRLGKRFHGFLRNSNASVVLSQAFRNPPGAGRDERLVHHAAYRRINDDARNEHPEKITALPHALDFAVDQVQKFIGKARGRSSLVAEIQRLFGDAMFDHGREQTSFAFEVTVDEALGAAGRCRDFTCGSYFVSLRCEQSQSGLNECLFLSGLIACSPGNGSILVPIFRSTQLGSAQGLSFAHSQFISAGEPETIATGESSIAVSFECDNFVYIL